MLEHGFCLVLDMDCVGLRECMGVLDICGPKGRCIMIKRRD